MGKYIVKSTHAESLASGRSVAPDAEVELTEEEENAPYNQRLIQEGILEPESAETPEPDPPHEPEHTSTEPQED